MLQAYKKIYTKLLASLLLLFPFVILEVISSRCGYLQVVFFET